MGFFSDLFDTRAAVVGGQQPSAHGEWSIFGSGTQSHAGVNVTVESGLGVPALYACVQVISQDIAKLPLITYRRLKRGKERATDWRGYSVLHDSPNPELTSYEWREYSSSHVASWGNAYSEIDWTNAGTVRGLWPLRPDRMRITRRNGRLIYRYTLPSGQEQELAAWRIHHTRGLGSDGVMGWSPVRMAMQSIGLNMAAEEYGARWYAGGGQPRVIAVHPGKLSEGAQKRLQGALEGSMNGLSNSHRIKVLEEGVALHTVGVPAGEAQFIESQEWGAHQIARLYRMPPHKIALLKNATFSNIEHQAIEYITDTLQPWLVRHEQALYRDLLSTSEQLSLFFEYLIEGALRGDIQSRYAAYAVGRNWGWLSANDIRERENLNPIDGGDVYLTPLNMTNGQIPPTRSAFARLYEDATGRLARREIADLRRGVDKHLRKGSAAQFRSWLVEFYADLREASLNIIAPVLVAGAEQRGIDAARAERQAHEWTSTLLLDRNSAWEDVLLDEDQISAVDGYLLRLERESASTMARALAQEVENLCN